MNLELKYPIKYAVLELKEPGGWAVGYKDITQGFIVSKCYVVGSEIKYYSNGENKITHKVVFPFKNISDFRISLQNGTDYNLNEVIPSYDACGRPYPIDEVSYLFDSYEQAHESAFKKNEKIEGDLILAVSLTDENWIEKYEKLKIEFLENLNICNQFENLILEKTENMDISDDQVKIKCKKLKRKIK